MPIKMFVLRIIPKQLYKRIFRAFWSFVYRTILSGIKKRTKYLWYCYLVCV